MKKLIFLTLAMALLLSLAVFATAFGEESISSTIMESASAGVSVNSDTHSAGGKDFPVRFDLRNNGVVTPVRIQDPWGSCWAFGSIAAVETSILTMLKEKGRPIDPKTFDLSEKHLIWFATNPISEAVDPDQMGEGMHITGADDNSYTNSLYGNGGYGLNTSTLFASGVGPVLEKYFPYQGKEGLTEKEYLEKYPEKGPDYTCEQGEEQFGMTFEEMVEHPEDEMVQMVVGMFQSRGYLSADVESLTVDALKEAFSRLYVDMIASDNFYCKLDDWTIPDTMTVDGMEILSRNLTSGYTLVDGNKLPSLFNRDADGKWESINWDGINAVKSELMNGHGVSAGFQADVSQPGQVGEEIYMSLETYAHYTYEDKGTSHLICIVGWDDEYPAENFLAGRQPPANGAWLAKNSWGSETDYVTNANGKDIGKSEWGLKNEEGKATGYFWISYYDKSLNYCESMTFDTDLAEIDGEIIYKMYDYMPSLIGVRTGQDTSEESSTVLKTANIFTNDIGYNGSLYFVSTKTAHPNATVKYSVYLLNENAENPEDGELLGTTEATYEYAGFHRSKLDTPIPIEDGKRFAVVAEETISKNGETLYEYAVNVSYSKEHAEAVKAAEAANGISSDDRDRNADEYGVAVVNKGESFIYENGVWTDWTEYEPRTRLLADYAIDNFSIKAYMIVKDIEL